MSKTSLDKSSELLSQIAGTLIPVSLGFLIVLVSGKTLADYSILITFLTPVTAFALYGVVLIGIRILNSDEENVKKTNFTFQQILFFISVLLMIITYVMVYLALSKSQN